MPAEARPSGEAAGGGHWARSSGSTQRGTLRSRGGRLVSARRGRCFVRKGGRGQCHSGERTSATAGCDVVERRGVGFRPAVEHHLLVEVHCWLRARLEAQCRGLDAPASSA
ncbi:unnamed protein product [Miscanthus lutarioriparius]|uniref:Uncharacterized protein n=1 Tax=Miscanthus lutarioriparius TaxID=422564 RepID=A0A811RWM8_9POAL|nr:unnamed protein product [Miscanthus lutarioriparius]